MRKLYTTILVSAIMTSTFATLPAIFTDGTGLEDAECMMFSYPDSNAVVHNSGDATVSIYPNPVKSFATISFTYSNIDKISIMNIVGREIKTINPEAGKQEVKVSLVDLQPGVYFLAAYYQGNTLITKKFLKED